VAQHGMMAHLGKTVRRQLEAGAKMPLAWPCSTKVIISLMVKK